MAENRNPSNPTAPNVGGRGNQQSQSGATQASGSQGRESSQGQSRQGFSGQGSPSSGKGAQSVSSPGDLSFRCKDMGYNECNWETRGRDENQMLGEIERHGREKHGLTNFDDNTRNRVRSNINRAA